VVGGHWCAVTPGVREDIWYRCGSCIERFVDDRIVRTLRGSLICSFGGAAGNRTDDTAAHPTSETRD
jgi:hypothetical protein